MKVYSIIASLLILVSCDVIRNINDEKICDLCNQSNSIVIDEYEILVLDLFTPNNDAINDLYVLTATDTAGAYELNEVFKSVIFRLYESSPDKPIFELENSPVQFDGRDMDGRFLDDGVYTYDLIIEDVTYTRKLGIIRNGICLDDYECGANCTMMDSGDPFIVDDCN